MIKYMKEPVTEECLLKAHNITWVELYKIKAEAIDNEFTLDDNLYELTGEDSYEYKQKELKRAAREKKKQQIHTKHPKYNISKGEKHHNGLTAKIAGIIIERTVATLYERTRVKNVVDINGWVVEKVMV
jgi:hypothetical protein